MTNPDLGAFSISLAVKDLSASIAFYEKLGFAALGGGEGWMMMRMNDKVIGLFQGMFDKNMMTFTPGFGLDGPKEGPFEDVRDLQAALKAAGVALTKEADPEGTGPDFITLEDPDGNPILIDQHVPKPE